MFTETRTADGSGRLVLGAGYELRAIPMGGGARYPLELRVNGIAGSVLRIDDDGVLRPQPWNHLEALGLDAGAQWLVNMAETPAERVGKGVLVPKMPVLLFGGDITVPVVGTPFFGLDGAQLSAPWEARAFDVRRFARVKLAVRSQGVSLYNTQTLSVGLVADDDGSTTVAGWTLLGAGSVNDFAPNVPRYGSIFAGEGLSDALDTHSVRTGTRYGFVRPYLSSTGDFGDGMDGAFYVQLWGYYP